MITDKTKKTRTLTPIDKARYARHLSMPEIGEAGQRKLAFAKVLVIGAGGLGSPAAYYLAAAGVGTVGIVDSDKVEVSNLQRQLLHFTKDIGRYKVDSAGEKLSALNPGIVIEKYCKRLGRGNAAGLMSKYDFVIDATDNFDSKMLIADACYKAKKPYSHAGILKFSGQTMTVIPGKTACYRCVFESAPPHARVAVPQGPLGFVPGVIGAIQASEAVKYIIGKGTLLTDCLLVVDCFAGNFRKVKLNRNASCLLCGNVRRKVTGSVAG